MIYPKEGYRLQGKVLTNSKICSTRLIPLMIAKNDSLLNGCENSISNRDWDEEII